MLSTHVKAAGFPSYQAGYYTKTVTEFCIQDNSTLKALLPLSEPREN